MNRWLFVATLAGCAAPPLESEAPLPFAADTGPYEPRPNAEPATAPTGARPAGRHRPTSTPSIERPDRAQDITVEFCDLADNDGDGFVDEGVANGCGECGGDRLDGADDDCDGLVDEGFLGADCLGDGDCDGALSCLDGVCGLPCPSECDDCDRCVGHLEADDDALIVSPDCDRACSECRGECDAAGGVCLDGGCVRDGKVSGGCRPGEEAVLAMSSWVEAGRVESRLVDLCVR